MSTHHWLKFAACAAHTDLEWFQPAHADACRAVCAGCPVRQQCVQAALQAGEPWGIWGGLDPAERAQLARRRGVPAPRVLPAHGTNARYAKHGCRCTVCRAAHTEYERRRRNQLSYRRPQAA